MATWKGSKDFGKIASYEEEEKKEKNIEMREVEKKGAEQGESGVMVDITNADSPLKNSVQSADELSTTPTIAESSEVNEAAKPVESSSPSIVSNTNETVRVTL